MAGKKRVKGKEAVELAIATLNPQALFCEEYREALIGAAYRGPEGRTVAVYDRDMCIDILIENEQMSHCEAVEYFESHTEGSYVGPCTPLFVSYIDSRDIEAIIEDLGEQ
jgi:hypothetical protein